MNQSIAALLIISLSIVTLGCEPEQDHNKLISFSTERQSVPIGVIGPMSGSEKKLGENCLAGIKTGLKYYGLDKTIGGIKLYVEDDQSRPEIARKAFIKLVEERGVKAVLLLSNSEIALALEDLAQRYEIPVFALVATHPDVAGEKSYISQLLFDDKAQALVAALYIRDEQLVDRVAVIIDKEYPHSASLTEQFIKNFTSTGGIPIEIPYLKNKQLFVTRLRSLQENKIGFIYAPLKAEYIKILAEQLAQINYKPALMGGDGLQAPLALNFPSTLKLLDGMLTTDSYSTDNDFTAFGKQISTLFGDSFDIQGTVYAAAGAEGASILIAALSGCGEKITNTCVHQKLRSTLEFVGLQSKVTIRRNGKAERPIFINRIDKGQFHGVLKVY